MKNEGPFFNVIGAFIFGVMAFCGSAIVGIITAVVTGVIGFGICGPTDGPNAGSVWAYLLLGFPFIASVAVMVWSYGQLKRRPAIADWGNVE